MRSVFETLNWTPTFMRVLTVAAALATFAHFGAPQAAAATGPQAFWASQPVKPNQTVFVHGSGITSSTTVLVQRLADTAPGTPGATVPALSAATSVQPISAVGPELQFVLPASFTNGVFAYQLLNGSTAGPVALVNAPDLWFLHGDRGDRSTPGGWVEVYGNSLSIPGGTTASIALMSGSTLVRTITVTPTANAYYQYFPLPADLPAGSYDLYYHNGFGGPSAWKHYAGFDSGPVTQLQVVSDDINVWERQALAATRTVTINFAAGKGSSTGWDPIFQAAIAKVRSFVNAKGQRAGGTIVLTAGTYNLGSPLVLPDKTVLIGAGQGKTILSWPGGVDYDPQAITGRPLVRGEVLVPWPAQNGTFGIQDLTLSRNFVQYGAQTVNEFNPVCIERSRTQVFGFIRRVTCTGFNTDGYAQWVNAHVGDSNNTRRDWNAAVFLAATRNTEVSQSVLDYPVGISANGNGAPNEYVQVRGNTIRWRYMPIAGEYALRDVIYSGNTETMAGTELSNGTSTFTDVGSFFGSYGYNLRDIYFGENVTQRETPGAPMAQVGVTLDAGNSVYVGRAIMSSGTSVTLANTTARVTNDRSAARVEYGAVVQVVAGTGAGQWRHLTSPVLSGAGATLAGVNQISVDRPWDVDLDSTSWVTIQSFLGRLIFHGNDLSSGPKLQSYYATHDVIVAENKLGTTGPVAAVSSWVGYTPGYEILAPGWHFQALDNTVRYNGAWFQDSVTPMSAAPNANLGAYPGFPGPYVVSHVIRGNIASAGSQPINVVVGPLNAGFLIENNTGLAGVLFPSTITQPMVGVVRANSTVYGVMSPMVEPSGNRAITNPGPNVIQN